MFEPIDRSGKGLDLLMLPVCLCLFAADVYAFTHGFFRSWWIPSTISIVAAIAFFARRLFTNDATGRFYFSRTKSRHRAHISSKIEE